MKLFIISCLVVLLVVTQIAVAFPAVDVEPSFSPAENEPQMLSDDRSATFTVHVNSEKAELWQRLFAAILKELYESLQSGGGSTTGMPTYPYYTTSAYDEYQVY